MKKKKGESLSAFWTRLEDEFRPELEKALNSIGWKLIDAKWPKWTATTIKRDELDEEITTIHGTRMLWLVRERIKQRKKEMRMYGH